MDAWATEQQRLYNLGTFRWVEPARKVKPVVAVRGDRRPCPRCGVERFWKAGRSVICRDCKDVMSEAEVALWVADERKQDAA